MSDSLIEQVKRLAEAQGDGAKWVKIEFPKVVWGTIFDFPALLAHMQAQQAVVDAAREARRQDDLSVNQPEHALVTDAAFDDWFQQRCVDHEKAYAALDAALEKVNDHEQ